MRPVHQVVFEDKKGDCFAACIASIIEVPLEEVPNFRVTAPDNMSGAARAWLKERGWRLMPMCFPSLKQLRATYFDFGAYCIVGGPSPRKDSDGTPRRHAVVAHTGAHNYLEGCDACGGYGLRVVHDPHPDGEGIVDDDEQNYRWVWFIVKA